MFKHLASFCLFLAVVLVSSNSLEAKSHSRRTKKKKSSSYKVSKHKRKSRHYKHGSGPDLKSITTDSPYKEDTNNGVNPIETTQPEQLEVKK